MQSLRATADALGAAAPLSWRDDDGLADVVLVIKTKQYPCHSGIVACGPRQIGLVRQHLLGEQASEPLDLTPHIPDGAREDPTLIAVFEVRAALNLRAHTTQACSNR